jgi:hypothetical protein
MWLYNRQTDLLWPIVKGMIIASVLPLFGIIAGLILTRWHSPWWTLLILMCLGVYAFPVYLWFRSD